MDSEVQYHVPFLMMRKVEYTDVKNDVVKFNSSTTHYLPLFNEYFDCVDLSSLSKYKLVV